MLKTKPFDETPGHCGVASFKIVLNYFGIKKTEKELTKLCGWNRTDGVSTKAILKVAKKMGFKGFIQDFSDIKDLKKYVLRKELPVVVDWFSTNQGHSSVVIDIDEENVYLQDPDIGHIRAMEIEVFKRVWFDFSGPFLCAKKDIIIRRMMVLYK